jgi:amino acid transporter
MRRVLGLTDLLLLAAASIGPAFSLATTFGPMLEDAGSGTPLALLLVTVIMAFVAVGYRRLGSRYPNAGSAYTWVRIAFGPLTGAYAAWILIVANVFAIAATSVPAGAYTLALFAPALAVSPQADACVGTLWVLACGALLYAGLRPSARVANTLLILELIVLTLTAIAAFAHPVVAHAVRGTPLPGVGPLVGAVVIGIWMTDGWEVSATTAEEAHDALRAPGLGGLGGLLVTAVVLFACMTAFLRVGTLAGYDANEGDAMAYVGGAIGGGAWRVAITLTVLVSLAASLQTTLVYLTRSFFAMGRDGLLPTSLGGLDARSQPHVAIALLTAVGMAFTLGSALSPNLRDAFAFILGGTSVFLGVLFMLSSAAAVRIFARDPGARIDGVALPAIAAVLLVVVLTVSVWQDTVPTRLFIIGAAVLGVPLAVWRCRALGRAGGARAVV